MAHSIEEIMQQLDAAHDQRGVRAALKVLVELLVDMEDRLDRLESVAHWHKEPPKVYDEITL